MAVPLEEAADTVEAVAVEDGMPEVLAADTVEAAEDGMPEVLEADTVEVEDTMLVVLAEAVGTRVPVAADTTIRSNVLLIFDQWSSKKSYPHKSIPINALVFK